MLDSKLISLLKRLDKDEFRELEKFAASPYFSKGRDLTPLYKALKPFYPEFNDEKLTVEFLFNRLFPGKKFEAKKSYNVIKTLSSQLFMLGKDFLIQLELDEDQKGKEYYLLNQLRKRKMYKEFDRDYEHSLRKNEYPEKGNVKDFVKNFMPTSVMADYALDKDEFENALENTFLTSENILVAALIRCFKFADQKNIAGVYNKNLRFTLMNSIMENLDADKMLNEIESNDGKFFPYLKIYHMIHRMNKHNDNIEYYFETKTLLQNSFHLFGQSENYELWNMMLTYCNVKNFSAEDALFRKEIHEIHKKMVELNIYKRSIKEDFHIVLFRNIVLTAAPLKDYNWLEDFINKYSDELHIDHREDMKNYSYAYLDFLKGKFETALEYIIKVKYELFLYKHDVKMLQIKIYYELNYFEEAFSLIDTLQHYLKNTKDLPEYHKMGYRNFLTHAKDLCKIRINSSLDLAELEYLEHKVNNNSKFGLEWVKNKLKELKGEVS